MQPTRGAVNPIVYPGKPANNKNVAFKKQFCNRPSCDFFILFNGRLGRMFKRSLSILILIIFLSGCSQSDSSPLPTQPAANFPTLAPDTLPICQTGDLDVSSNADSGSDKVVMGMTLSNKSQHICTLSNPPKASLLDKDKKPLQLRTALNPSQPDSKVPALLQLSPGEIVIFALTWENFCQPGSIKNLTLRLTLDDGKNLDESIQIGDAPSCKDKSRPSDILIGAFSSPP